MNYSQKLITSLEMPRKTRHKILMRSNQRFTRYSAHKLFRWLFSSKCPLSATLFLMDSPRKLIRSAEIPIAKNHHINFEWDPANIPCRAHKLFDQPFFSKCPPSGILFLLNSSQKLMRLSEIPRETHCTILM